MSLLVRSRKFFHLPGKEKTAFMEAILLLPIIVVAVKLIPFRFLSLCLGTHMATAANINNAIDDKKISTIKQSLQRVCILLPLVNVCLPRAMTAKLMLARRGMASTLFMGVKKDYASGELRAHAWLTVGDITLTGEREKSDFTVVASFA